MNRKPTKRELACLRKADWQKALEEGRVVRMLDGTRMISFPTIARRDEFLAQMENTGEDILEIVRLPKFRDLRPEGIDSRKEY